MAEQCGGLFTYSLLMSYFTYLFCNSNHKTTLETTTSSATCVYVLSHQNNMFIYRVGYERKWLSDLVVRKEILKDLFAEKMEETQSSQLAHITANTDDPMVLFGQWLNEAESNDTLGWLKVMNLATVNRKFVVLSRNVILRKFDQSGFVFVTERNSRKFADMSENPKVAATFLWKYKLNDNLVLKQIRINGSVSELSAEEIRQFYAEERLSARIRCKICVCGNPVDWDELKHQHDQVLENFLNGSEKLEQNENYTALRIRPESIDFHFAMPGSIGDRIVYTLDDWGNWSHQHVCA